MAYEIIIDNEKKCLFVHSDLCEHLMEIKDDFELNNKLEYINMFKFEEVEEFLEKYEDYEVIYCELCRPCKNRDILDEEYDDFYEEFAEDEDLDSTRCDIF